MKRFFTFLFVFLFLAYGAYANDLRLSGLDVVSVNTSANTMIFKVDVSQKNGWRNTVSHDAAWIFLKYSTDAGQTWDHATMAGIGKDPAGFSTTSGYEIVVPQDQKGFFLRRNVMTSGDVTAEGVRFTWNYGVDGLSDETVQAANTLTHLFGVEMVYIPEGAF
ncbi:MAG: hypothetical protein GX606_05515, partial [Elusimicrobia bacterium]|nr:hypothetical protein [Elusimicrobiota bacterium]